MPRTARYAPGGMIFHVLNRGVGRMRLFLKDGDFEAFERTIERTLETCPMRICACGRVAMVESLASDLWNGRRSALAWQVAIASPAQLG